MFKKIALSTVAAATALTALPAAASANHYDRGYNNRGGYYESQYRDRYYGQRQYDDRYYGQSQYDDRYYGRTDRRYYGDRRCSGTTGTIVGGAGGALIGRAIDGGRNRTTGTIAGGVIGALLGRGVGKNSCRSRY